MKVKIHYTTTYSYREAVSFSPHIFRLCPKADPTVAVDRFSFETNANADVQQRRDLFDNIVMQCFYPGTADELRVKIEIDLRLEKKNAFHFILASHAVEMPFRYEPAEAAVLSPFLQMPAAPVELPFWKLEPKSSTVSALVGLNGAIYDHIKYERREEGAARSPAETLAAGAGACRDVAVLLAETLRGIGVAARLASGYLWEAGESEEDDGEVDGDGTGGSGRPSHSERRAERALHAWTEAYLPGAGWVGMDPTNGTFCNHNHITAAVGLAPEDITPISGRYYSKVRVPATMSSDLQLHCDE